MGKWVGNIGGFRGKKRSWGAVGGVLEAGWRLRIGEGKERRGKRAWFSQEWMESWRDRLRAAERNERNGEMSFSMR